MPTSLSLSAGVDVLLFAAIMATFLDAVMAPDGIETDAGFFHLHMGGDKPGELGEVQRTRLWPGPMRSVLAVHSAPEVDLEAFEFAAPGGSIQSNCRSQDNELQQEIITKSCPPQRNFPWLPLSPVEDATHSNIPVKNFLKI